MSDLFDVSGKTALVTGGSRGIGLMIARGLVQAGARVFISSRKVEDLEASAAELQKHGKCEAIPADLSTPEGARGLGEAIRERTDRLEILSTTRARRGGRRWRSSRPAAGTGRCTRTSRPSST